MLAIGIEQESDYNIDIDDIIIKLSKYLNQ